MLSKFSLQSLGTLISVQGGFAFKSKDFKEAGVPVLKIKNIRLRCIDYSDIEYVDAKVANDASRYFCQTGDILISMTGSGPQAPNSVVGRVARFTDRDGKFLFNQRVGRFVIKDTKRLDARFLFFVLTRPEYQLELVSTSTGSANQANISARQIEGLRIPIPPFHTQKAIASVLGALDDKIELNRRMNETLEAMGRAIFKDWFVDFGPTRAKQEGHAPYLATDIWSLFPNRLDDEGKPEGWKSGSLGELIEIGPSEPMRKGELTPYLDMAALPTRGSTADSPILREFSSGTRFRNGDTLLARITPCLENGKTALVQNLPANTIGWGSTEFIVMRSILPVPKPVSYLLAREPAFRRHAIQSMTGTSGRQRATAEAISAYPVSIPLNEHVWTALATILTPSFAKIATNAEETQTLAATRDLLLPKLMSGEVRVKDAEKIFGEAP